ncbi:MAG: hypothetical protein AB7V46_19795, partial [Thermomicrobiales bacterium]
MFERGRARGNYEETLRNSLDKLAECETKHESASLVASLTRPTVENHPTGDFDEEVSALADAGEVGSGGSENDSSLKVDRGSPEVGDSDKRNAVDEGADLERLAKFHRVSLKNRGFSSPRAERVYRPSKTEVPGP